MRYFQMPKSVKGRSCSHAIRLFKHSQRVWAETKYDGERAQIHVEIDGDGSSRITIFSKSKRDSTLDRWALHPCVTRASSYSLGLTVGYSIIRNTLGLAGFGSGDLNKARKFVKNLVLDAEMVAFCDHDEKIDGPFQY
jgi:DNA ligase-4